MSGDEKAGSKLRLMDLAVRYFRKEGFKVNQESPVLEGFSGISRKFDLIVQKGRVEQGVWIRDWNRTIGVNVIINLDMASDDVGKITLLTRQKIAMSLR
jgi:hypothetical protein